MLIGFYSYVYNTPPLFSGSLTLLCIGSAQWCCQGLPPLLGDKVVVSQPKSQWPQGRLLKVGHHNETRITKMLKALASPK